MILRFSVLPPPPHRAFGNVIKALDFSRSSSVVTLDPGWISKWRKTAAITCVCDIV